MAHEPITRSRGWLRGHTSPNHTSERPVCVFWTARAMSHRVPRRAGGGGRGWWGGGPPPRGGGPAPRPPRGRSGGGRGPGRGGGERRVAALSGGATGCTGADGERRTPDMTFLITCPNCGPRSVEEFAYGGESTKRPGPTAAPTSWRATSTSARTSTVGRPNGGTTATAASDGSSPSVTRIRNEVRATLAWRGTKPAGPEGSRRRRPRRRAHDGTTPSGRRRGHRPFRQALSRSRSTARSARRSKGTRSVRHWPPRASPSRGVRSSTTGRAA